MRNICEHFQFIDNRLNRMEGVDFRAVVGEAPKSCTWKEFCSFHSSDGREMPGLNAAVEAFGMEKFEQMLMKVCEFANRKEWECRIPIVANSVHVFRLKPEQILWLLANSFFDNTVELQGCGTIRWTNLFFTLESVGKERLLCLFDYFSHIEEHLNDREFVECFPFGECVFCFD